MNATQKRRFYWLLAFAVMAALAVGMLVGYGHRSKPICPDDKPPIKEQDQGVLGNVLFMCANGQIVTTG